MRILFVTPQLNWPLRSGGQLRLWNILQALIGMAEVDVLALQSPAADGEQVFKGASKVTYTGNSFLVPTQGQRRAYNSTYGRLALLLSTARPFMYLGPDNGTLTRWFREHVEQGNYDAIWICRASSAHALGWKDPSRTILDGDNFDYVLEYQLLSRSGWYGAKMLNYLDVIKLAYLERQLLDRYAYVVRCSEEDRRRVPHRRAVVVPNGTTVLPMRERSPKRRLLFVGTLSYAPNGEGIQWFLRSIWPLVRSAEPDAEVDIVGGGPSQELKSQSGKNGILVHGFVPEMRPYWDTAVASIAPLLAGSGTRLKILESLANGVPVVSTEIGAFGLDLTAADGILRADFPESFAAGCVEMIRNPEQATARGCVGREAVSAKYSWENIHVRIQRLVREMVCRNQQRAQTSQVRSIAVTSGR